jgi:ATP-dependent DNA helicase Q1
MLTGSTSKEASRDIFSRLTASARGNAISTGSEIKLCYVTPEKIAKSKTFMSMLEKLANGGRLGAPLRSRCAGTTLKKIDSPYSNR